MSVTRRRRQYHCIPRWVKQEWYEKQKGMCYYCGVQMNMRKEFIYKDERKLQNPDFATWDHIIPWIRGGTDARNNLVLACYQCNQEKGDKRTFTPSKLRVVERYELNWVQSDRHSNITDWTADPFGIVLSDGKYRLWLCCTQLLGEFDDLESAKSEAENLLRMVE